MVDVGILELNVGGPLHKENDGHKYLPRKPSRILTACFETDPIDPGIEFNGWPSEPRLGPSSTPQIRRAWLWRLGKTM